MCATTNSTNGHQRGYVVSDLHLFTHRTTANKRLSAIRDVAGRADFLVLNGDIFDFRWSTLDSLSQTAETAVDWLTTMTLAANGCKVFYVLGNHDRFAFFAEHLDALAAHTDNFHWHPTHMRIGRCLFLHGDLAFDRRCPDPFGRPMLPPEHQRGRAMNLGYRVIVATRAHRFTQPFYHPRRCARRILSCLDRHHPTLGEGLTDVYFGHTHRTFVNFRHNGVAFHNTGSSIRHLRSILLRAYA